jgi:photosystem II stability/assembly factor-like uncharacterized protein
MKKQTLKTSFLPWLLLGCIVFSSGQLFGQSSWISIGPEGGSVSRIAQDFSNANVLYLISADYPQKMFKSTNKGGQWTEMAMGFSSSLVSLELNRKNPSEMFTCGYGSFYRSTNSGSSWTTVNLSNGYFYDLTPDSVDQNILHASGYEWNSSTSTTNMIYLKSTNKGSDWNKSFLPTIENGFGYAVAVEPKNSNHVWVGGYQYAGGVTAPKLFRTTNGGTSWTEVTGTLSGDIQDIFVDSTNVKRILVVTTATTYYSTNNGASWNTCTGYPNGHRITQDPSNKNTFYIAGYSNAYKSTDGGMGWNVYINGLSSAKNGSDILVDRTSSSMVFGSYLTGFYKSTNSGTDWNSFNTGLQISNITALELSPEATPTLYAAVNQMSLFKTTNPLQKVGQADAVVWQMLTKFWDDSNTKLTDLKILPTNPNILYASDLGT